MLMDKNMDMIRVNVFEAKAKLSSLLAKVEKGETVVVCRRNVPIAEIRPARSARPKRRLGLGKGKFKLTKAFFEPLPDWLLDAFEGK